MAGIFDAIQDPEFLDQLRRGVISMTGADPDAAQALAAALMSADLAEIGAQAAENASGSLDISMQMMQDDPAMAVMGLLGSIGSKGARMAGPDMQTGRIAGIFEPPTLKQRPFENDYPNDPTSAGDGGRRIEVDLDGRPLTARYVAGRRMAGEMDQGLSGDEADRVASGLGITTRSANQYGPELKGSTGLFKTYGSDQGPLKYIYLDKELAPESASKVFRHELGHAIDDVAGEKMPVQGLMDELNTIYGDLNTAKPYSPDQIVTPQKRGYPKEEETPELMAEALRAYMTDPNYIKTVAPKTAARIREYVNTHPELKDIIQFNTIAGAGLLGAAVNGRDRGD